MPANEAATVLTEAAILDDFSAPPTQTFRAPLAQFYGNLRFRGNVDRGCQLNGRLGMLRSLCATASLNEVVLIRLTK
jgi:hypothetical protein